MPVSFGGFGGSTNWPFGPPKDWMTPTDGFPGSPTSAIWIVTTPGLPTLGTAEPEAALVVAAVPVVVLDDVLDDLLPPPHAATPTDSAASRAASAIRRRSTRRPL